MKEQILEALKREGALGRMDQKWFDEGFALLRELEASQVVRHMQQNHQPEMYCKENRATLVYVCRNDDDLETEPGDSLDS